MQLDKTNSEVLIDRLLNPESNNNLVTIQVDLLSPLSFSELKEEK